MTSSTHGSSSNVNSWKKSFIVNCNVGRKLNIFLLNVDAVSPVCRPPMWQYRGASLLEEFKVSCALEALPPILEVTWTFNSTGESVYIPQV